MSAIPFNDIPALRNKAPAAIKINYIPRKHLVRSWQTDLDVREEVTESIYEAMVASDFFSEVSKSEKILERGYTFNIVVQERQKKTGAWYGISQILMLGLSASLIPATVKSTVNVTVEMYVEGGYAGTHTYVDEISEMYSLFPTVYIFGKSESRVSREIGSVISTHILFDIGDVDYRSDSTLTRNKTLLPKERNQKSSNRLIFLAP